MKVNEFVLEHGWDAAKRLVENNRYTGRILSPSELDLKRLVESHDLVGDYYGLARAKEHAESNYTAPELKAALKQAIADVESCQ